MMKCLALAQKQWGQPSMAWSLWQTDTRIATKSEQSLQTAVISEIAKYQMMAV
jgi:hypothetical protein